MNKTHHGARNWILGAALLCTGAAQAAFIQNGSFETLIGITTSPLGFATINGTSSSSLFGWTATDVDVIDTIWTAADGNYSLDLSSTVAGSIHQDIDTVAGETYTITFALAGNPAAGFDPIKSVQVDLIDVGSSNALIVPPPVFNFDVTGATTTDMGWIDVSVTFTAISTLTRLQFTSLNNSAAGPALDNVRIATVAVPEASAALLFGAGLLGMAGLRRREEDTLAA